MLRGTLSAFARKNTALTAGVKYWREKDEATKVRVGTIASADDARTRFLRSHFKFVRTPKCFACCSDALGPPRPWWLAARNFPNVAYLPFIAPQGFEGLAEAVSESGASARVVHGGPELEERAASCEAIRNSGMASAARRSLPMSSRVRNIFEVRWQSAGKPAEGWVWPAPTRSGHLESSSLKKQHNRAFKLLAAQARNDNSQPVRRFVLYSLRHTFLTRLGESGCDAWTLARIAGHSSVAISTRYVHPSDDAVFTAVERLGGHKSRHTREIN